MVASLPFPSCINLFLALGPSSACRLYMPLIVILKDRQGVSGVLSLSLHVFFFQPHFVLVRL